MKTITITEEEQIVILYALQDRRNRMYRDAEAYKRNYNKHAMMDCLNEVKKADEVARLIKEAK